MARERQGNGKEEVGRVWGMAGWCAGMNDGRVGEERADGRTGHGGRGVFPGRKKLSLSSTKETIKSKSHDEIPDRRSKF